jgi:hypothetical protein
MSRPLIAFLLSLLTYFGGHCYNGRWAKALLFAILLIAAIVASLLAVFVFYAFLVEENVLFLGDGFDEAGRLKVCLTIVTCILAAIWVTSALVAAVDARRDADPEAGPEDTAESPLVRSLVALAMCSFALLVAAAVPAIWYGASWLPKTLTQSPLFVRMPLGGRPIFPGVRLPLPDMKTSLPQKRTGYLGSTGTYFGHFDWNSQKVLAASSGTIQGTVRANGKPVARLKLRLFLAPDLRTQWATSDREGRYSIAVPSGKYRLAGWELDNVSADVVVAGMIRKEPSWFFDWSETTGKILDIKAEGVTAGPDMEFIDPVERVHPILGVHVAPDVVFRWKPYPGTSHYTLQVQDHGSHPYRRTESLAPFFHMPRKIRGTTTTARRAGYSLEPGHYYSWQVSACDSNGRTISQSADPWSANFKVE